MHKGGCLCDRVRYQYEGEIEEISRCYCTQCQKAQGTAFVAVAPVQADRLKIVQGQEFLKEFRASPGKARVFCAECGSPLYSTREDLPDIKRLRIGTLETPIGATRQYHAFVSAKVSWYEINDKFSQHPGLPRK